MIKVAFMAALLAGAVVIALAAPALADSTEPASGQASGTTGDSAQPAGPDDPIGDIATPNPATDPSAAIALPPIYVPDGDSGDSGDYTPPESDDDGADDTATPSDGTQN
jgi:hypothetical protein